MREDRSGPPSPRTRVSSSEDGTKDESLPVLIQNPSLEIFQMETSKLSVTAG